MHDITSGAFLQHFAAGTNIQGTAGVSDNTAGTMTPYAAGEGLSAEMHTYYSDYLIDNAEPYLCHELFAQKHRIPKGGKTVCFRKYDLLPKCTTPIVEGVTPDGQSLRVTVVEATVAQYGGYVELTDLLSCPPWTITSAWLPNCWAHRRDGRWIPSRVRCWQAVPTCSTARMPFPHATC